MRIPYVKLKQSARTPTQARADDAGYDLYASERVVLNPFERKIIPTDIAMAIPQGYYGRIADRSGLAVKNGIHVLAGVIDSQYRGSVGVVLINLDVLGFLSYLITQLPGIKAFSGLFGLPGQFAINEGDKIAQIIIEKCHTAEWEETEQLDATERGAGGFGSSGK
jgi:dUTP pyrophosphatase